MTDIRKGGCLCGKVRYEVDVSGHETGNCHCRDCQKNAGAPYMTFTAVPVGQFKWIVKPGGAYSASPAAERRFCEHCGTPLQWDAGPASSDTSFSTATLDDPSGLPVAYEIYTRTRMTGVPMVAGAAQHKAGSGP